MGNSEPVDSELQQLRVRLQELERREQEEERTQMKRELAEEERAHLLEIERELARQVEASHERLTVLLDNLPDAFMIFDEQWRYIYINPQARPYTGKPWQTLLGKNVWEEFPALIDTAYYEQYQRALSNQELVTFEVFAASLSLWFDVRAYPVPGGLAVYFRDISERKRAEEERLLALEEARAARMLAETALQVRNDFLSSVSHDLKTPLAVMKGNVQLLQRRLRRGVQLDPVWSGQRLEMIDASIEKMNGMVEDLLNVAKRQTGQELDLDLQPVELNALLQRISLEQQQTTKRHRILVLTESETLFVHADALRLDRALNNLLTNAIKYSPAGGQITVTLTQTQEQDQHWITISLQDEGIGIPAADLPHIFDPFYRAGNVTNQIQGTGIGLASVAQVIEQHGGKVSVSSEEGQGSCFTVQLPLSTEQQNVHAPLNR